MPLDHDQDLVLDDTACVKLIAARTAERTARIEANVQARKQSRAEKLGAAGATDAGKAATAKTTALTAADAQKATFDAEVQKALADHAVKDAPAEAHYDPVRGVLACKAQPTVLVQGKPPKERKRLAMNDKDADDYAASYKLSCAASDEAADLTRQIERYKEAHPALFAAGPGDPPPVDPAYEALKTALDAKQATAQSEMAVQGALVQKYLAGETVTYYVGIKIESGEIVLGDRDEEE